MSKLLTSLLGLVIIGVVVYAFSPPLAVVYIVACLVAVTIAVTMARGNKVSNEQLWAGLTAQAFALENMQKSGFSTTTNFALEKGEKFIAKIDGIGLGEYKSSGSTYQGGNAGVSFPIFGRVRANVGGSRGKFVRNPPQLVGIDMGSVSYTTTRVIFTGPQQTRVFDLDKVVNFEPGLNGLTVTISTANREATSMLMTENNAVLAPGILFDIASVAHNEGEAVAIEKLGTYAQLLRQTVADAQRAKR